MSFYILGSVVLTVFHKNIFKNVILTNILLTVCYYHVTYEFQSESTLHSLSECQGTP